jgi:hypothetical protein
VTRGVLADDEQAVGDTDGDDELALLLLGDVSGTVSVPREAVAEEEGNRTDAGSSVMDGLSLRELPAGGRDHICVASGDDRADTGMGEVGPEGLACGRPPALGDGSGEGATPVLG